MEVFCDQCGCETDSSESMPDPKTDTGDLCHECYEKALYRFNVSQGAEWMRQRLPTMENFGRIYARHCRLPLGGMCLEGNCHAAATALARHLQHKGIQAKVKRGHWLGGDVRPSRQDFVGEQHSWVQLEVPDNSISFYVDPTQFVFTGAEPQISISTEDDRRYDPGGYTLKELILGTRTMPERNGGQTFPTKFSEGAQRLMDRLYGNRDWRRWTTEEMQVVANINPDRLGPFAKEIFSRIAKAGHRAMIPIDARMEVMGGC